MELHEFHRLLGRTVMYCQCIEADVKMLYAAMRKGDFAKNYETVSKKPLGDILIDLRDLDRTDDDPFLSDRDYDFLLQMKNRRNHWCHEAYVRFIYISDFPDSDEYREECDRLIDDCERLGRLSQRIERIRLTAMDEYDIL